MPDRICVNPAAQQEEEAILFFRRPARQPSRSCSVQCLDVDVFDTLKELSHVTGLSLSVVTCKLLRAAFEHVRIVEAEEAQRQSCLITRSLAEMLREG